MVTLESFNYAIFDRDETALPAAVPAAVPAWIAASWPFTAPRFVGAGLDLTWAEWLALPER